MSDIERSVLEAVYGVERAINRLNETLAHFASQFEDEPEGEIPAELKRPEARIAMEGGMFEGLMGESPTVEQHAARDMASGDPDRMRPRTAEEWERLYRGKCIECDALHSACNAEAARADKLRKTSEARLKEMERLEGILRARDAGR